MSVQTMPAELLIRRAANEAAPRRRPSAAGVAATAAAGCVTGSAVGALTVGGMWPAWALTAAGLSTVVALLAAAETPRDLRKEARRWP